MPVTYDKIATTTLSSAASSVTFSSISGSYTDLIVVGNIGYTASGYDSWIRFNGDTGTNYSYTVLYANPGTGGSAGSTRGTSTSNILFDRQGDYTAISGSGYSHIMNYANTTTYKTVLNRFGQPSSSVEAKVGLWRNTSAITSIVIGVTTTTFASGSTFTLYGVKAA